MLPSMVRRHGRLVALVPYINKEGDVEEVCVGTNKKNVFNIIMIAPVLREIIMGRLRCCGVLTHCCANKHICYGY